jgi:hypothetical protein
MSNGGLGFYDIGELDIGQGGDDLSIVGDELAEMIGEDDVVSLMGRGGGDDVESLLAASMGGARARGRLARALLARRLGQRGAVVTTRGPTKSREFPIGFDSGPVLIVAGAATQIISRPQVPFRPERFVVPSDIAGSFTIDDIKVGKDSQLVATGPIPARIFEEGSFGVRLSMDTAQVANDITVSATNVSLAAARFRAAMIGTAVE